MSHFDQAHLVDLIDLVLKAVATGVLAGAVWSLVFRIKTRPGE